jgi:hypothetical protein
MVLIVYVVNTHTHSIKEYSLGYVFGCTFVFVLNTNTNTQKRELVVCVTHTNITNILEYVCRTHKYRSRRGATQSKE